MSNFALAAPAADINDLPQQMAQTPMPVSAGYAAEAGAAVGDMSMRAVNLLVPRDMQEALTFGQGPGAGPLPGPRVLDSETANEMFQAPGLRFNTPVNADDARLQWQMANEKAVREDVLTKTAANRNPLLDFGAGMIGGLFDPLGLTIMGMTGGLGEAALTRMGWGVADASGGIISAGRVANALRVPAAGLIENAPFVAANAALTDLSGDDYSVMDGLRDLALGAIVHTTVHAGLRLLGAHERDPTDPLSQAPANAQDPSAPKFEPPTTDLPTGADLEPVRADRPPGEPTDFVPSDGVPDEIDQLPPDARRGAWLIGLDQMNRGEDVDVAGLIDKEREIPAPTALDEPTPEVTIPSWRPAAEPVGQAISTLGRATPVQYGLVEMRDLLTSHNDDLSVNGAYPSELQPRDRARAGSMAANFQLEQRLDPRLLMDDVSAAAGAPIVSPGGIVESGNGRIIALRRAMAKGSDVAKAYRAELEARGHDTSGMENPVRVRVRAQALTAPERAALAHEWNRPVTETMSATEQAAADAEKIDHVALSKLDGTPAGEREFARYFLQHIAMGDINALANAAGELSRAGRQRIEAALMTKAYGDERLVSALFEDADTNIKGIGEALRQAAPAWAAMRAAIERGEAPAGMDLTGPLRSAIEIVRGARDAGVNTGRHIGELLSQLDAFSEGTAISPETEAVLRLFFREGKEGAPIEASFTRARAAATVAEVLKTYAQEVEATSAGADMFGFEPGAAEAGERLAGLTREYATGGAGIPEPAASTRLAPAPRRGAKGAEIPPSLFGELNGTDPTQGIIEDLNRKFALGDTGESRQLRPGGRTEADIEREAGGGPEANEPRPAVIGDVEGGGQDAGAGRGGAGEAGGAGKGEGRGAEPGAAGGAEPAGGAAAEPVKGQEGVEPAPSGDQVIAADPELTKLDTDTSNAAGAFDVKPEANPAEDPDTVAKAFAAAATCLMDAAEEIF